MTTSMENYSISATANPTSTNPMALGSIVSQGTDPTNQAPLRRGSQPSSYPQAGAAPQRQPPYPSFSGTQAGQNAPVTLPHIQSLLNTAPLPHLRQQETSRGQQFFGQSLQPQHSPPQNNPGFNEQRLAEQTAYEQANPEYAARFQRPLDDQLAHRHDPNSPGGPWNAAVPESPFTQPIPPGGPQLNPQQGSLQPRQHDPTAPVPWPGSHSGKVLRPLPPSSEPPYWQGLTEPNEADWEVLLLLGDNWNLIKGHRRKRDHLNPNQHKVLTNFDQRYNHAKRQSKRHQPEAGPDYVYIPGSVAPRADYLHIAFNFPDHEPPLPIQDPEKRKKYDYILNWDSISQQEKTERRKEEMVHFQNLKAFIRDKSNSRKGGKEFSDRHAAGLKAFSDARFPETEWFALMAIRWEEWKSEVSQKRRYYEMAYPIWEEGDRENRKRKQEEAEQNAAAKKRAGRRTGADS